MLVMVALLLLIIWVFNGLHLLFALIFTSWLNVNINLVHQFPMQIKKVYLMIDLL